MKLTLKLILLLAITAIIAPLFLKGPDGRPIMTLDELLPENNPVTGPSKTVIQKSLSHTTAIYRWQDDKGQWHYSDTPPAHTESENVTLKPVNTLPAQPTGPDNRENRNTQPYQESEQADIPRLQDLPDTLSPASTRDLIRQAKETERRIKERQAKLDALIQNP